MNYRKKSIIAVFSSMAMAFLCIFHVSSVETEAAVRVMPLGDSIKMARLFMELLKEV